jgi:ATP-dependent DNA helicase RecQ
MRFEGEIFLAGEGADQHLELFEHHIGFALAALGHQILIVHDLRADHAVHGRLVDPVFAQPVSQLVARGLLSPDPSRMGALTVTERARPVLEGRETVSLRRLSATPARVKKARTSSPGGAPADVTDADRALFEVLRTERRAVADADGVPPYVVFPDRTLWELVAAKPQTPEQLLAVNGIGPVKAEKYGARFLELLRS